MYRRLLQLPFQDDKSFFLFGPRGTGKTTCVTINAPNAMYFDLLETRLYKQFISDPQSLESAIPNGF